MFALREFENTTRLHLHGIFYSSDFQDFHTYHLILSSSRRSSCCHGDYDQLVIDLVVVLVVGGSGSGGGGCRPDFYIQFYIVSRSCYC